MPASGAADIVARAMGAVALGTRRRGRRGRAVRRGGRRDAPTSPDQLEQARAGGRAGWPPRPAGTGCCPWPPAWPLVLVVTGTVGALTRSTSAPSLNASAAAAPGPSTWPAVRVPAAPSTTVPSAASGSASPQFKAAAPSPDKRVQHEHAVQRGSLEQARRQRRRPRPPRHRRCRAAPSASRRRSSRRAPSAWPSEGRPGADHDPADGARRLLRRLRRQLADAVGLGRELGGAPYGSITLEVPVDTFASVLKQAQSFGTTSNLTTKATDVTGQYVDLQARLSPCRRADSST